MLKKSHFFLPNLKKKSLKKGVGFKIKFKKIDRFGFLNFKVVFDIFEAKKKLRIKNGPAI